MHLNINYKTYSHKSLKTFWIQEFTSILYISYQTFGETVILTINFIHLLLSFNLWYSICTTF